MDTILGVVFHGDGRLGQGRRNDLIMYVLGGNGAVVAKPDVGGAGHAKSNGRSDQPIARGFTQAAFLGVVVASR
ncbi:hypothetical protein D3C74_489620 [compost metagenome]